MRARIRIALLLVGMLVAASCSHGPTVQETIHNSDKRISVVSMNTLPTSIGPVVVGEVRNASRSPVDGVQIAVSLTDRAGQAIGNQFGFTLLKVLPPGAKAPFSIPYTGGTHDVGKVSATVRADPSVQMQYTTVQVVTKTAQALGTDYEVTGTVSNSSSMPVNFANIVGTFYDKSGHVVGAAHDVSDATTIPPGGTTKFNLIVQEQASKIATYSLTAEAQVVDQGH
ncbi:MAG TPA: FxLYD domain-containing protein [Actinomycetota bacterium]